MKKTFFVSILFSISLIACGQKNRENQLIRACGFSQVITIGTQELSCDDKASKEVDEIISKITSLSGVAKKFNIIQCNQLANCLATHLVNKQGFKEQCIIYDVNFLADIEKNTNRWGWISAVAHEVAHHLNNDLLNDGDNPEAELNADYFSGFILRKMNCPALKDAQAAMNLIAPDYDTPSHPKRSTRLIAIENGWRAAGGEPTVTLSQSVKVPVDKDENSSTVLDQSETLVFAIHWEDSATQRTYQGAMIAAKGQGLLRVKYEDDACQCLRIVEQTLSFASNEKLIEVIGAAPLFIDNGLRAKENEYLADNFYIIFDDNQRIIDAYTQDSRQVKNPILIKNIDDKNEKQQLLQHFEWSN